MRGKLLLAGALLAGLSIAACANVIHNPKLDAKYDYTVGDDIAQRTSSILRITAGIEEPTLVYYDRDHRDVVAEIIGSTDNVEGAKHEIEAIVDVIRANVLDYAKRQHHLDLTDNDVTLIYYVDSDQGVPVEVVRREKGQYVVPKAGAGEND